MLFKTMIVLPMIAAVLTTMLVPHAPWTWFFGFYYAYQVLAFLGVLIFNRVADDTVVLVAPAPARPTLDTLRDLCQYQINRGTPVRDVIERVCSHCTIQETALIMAHLELPETDLERTWIMPAQSMALQ